MWHETDIKGVVSLLMNFDAGTIHSAALLGYDSDEPLQHAIAASFGTYRELIAFPGN